MDDLKLGHADLRFVFEGKSLRKKKRMIGMATINRIEDLEIWQMARDICRAVHKLTQKELFRKDFSLVDQIRRSSGSIMDNIAEGFEREGNKEFINFLSISKGSAGETRSQMYRAFDQGYITQVEFDSAKDMLLSESVKIKHFMTYLNQSPLKGNKFKR
ncbi:MAG TPA: four helix bundle protein [Bacteroidales bacterium]|nr:four helix bundle protein [Bacteroidales bacterium]